MAKAALAAGGRGDWRVFAVLLFAVAVSIDGLVAGVAEGLRGIRVPLGSLLVMNVVSAVVVFLSLGSGRVVAGFLAPLTGRLVGGGVLIALGGWMLWRGRAATAPAGEGEHAAGTACGDVAIGRAWVPHSPGAYRTDRTRGRRQQGAGKAAGSQVDAGAYAGTAQGEARGKAAGGGKGKPDVEGEGEGGGKSDIGGVGGAGVRAAESREARRAFCWPARLVRSLAMVPGLLDEPARADLDSSGTLTPGEAFLLGLALAIDALGVGFGAGMAGLSSTLTPLIAGVTQFVFVSAGITLGRRIKMSALAPGLEKVPGGILILLGLMRLR